MAGIGDLVANLAVNKGNWSTNLNSAKTEFSTFSSGISSGLGKVAGLFATTFGVKVSVDAYSESLTQARKLESVLRSTGGAAGLSGQEIADYSAELQRMTNFEDDATVGAAAILAGFKNIKGDVFKEALASAQDLTAVIGGDLDSNVKLLGKALSNPTEGLAKLSRAGVQFTTEQQAQIAALQESGDMLAAQGIIMNTVAGQFGGAAQATADPMKQLSNTIGDVAENVGSLLVPMISVGANAISDLLGVVVGGGESFKSLGIEAAVQLSSVGQYLVFAGTQAELFFVQIGEGATHFFTAAMPEYLNWFSSNWQEIFVTIGSNTLTVFENLAGNIRSVMTEVWDYIASGGKNKMELSWTPLTKGFINTVESLPDIPDRVVTEFEKSLAQSIEDQGNLIAESQAEMRAKLEKQFSPLNGVAKVNQGEFSDLAKPEKEKAAKPPKETFSASLFGSSQAASVMFKGLTGGSTDPQLSEMKIQTQIQKQTLEATKKIKPGEPKIID